MSTSTGGSYKTRGLILRRSDYGEADRIYTFLTPDRKIGAIAKGVRRRTAKLSSHLELFVDIELMCIRGKSLDTITSARRVKHYDLVVDYERMKRGFLFLEMADRLTDTEGTEEAYGVLSEGLQSLDDGIAVELCELSFKLRLLSYLGSAPNLSRPTEDYDAIGLDVERGVLGAASSVSALPISKEAVNLWRLLLLRPLNQVMRVGGAQRAAESSLPVLDRFIDHQLGLRFKSTEI